MTTKKTKRQAVVNKPEPIELNLRAGLYNTAKLSAAFNPISLSKDEEMPHIADFTIDPTNKTRKVLSNNSDAMNIVNGAGLVVVDNLGYKQHMPDKVVVVHYGNSMFHNRRNGGKDNNSVIAGVFNVTEEQKMFNAAAIGIFKNIGIPILVLGDKINELDHDMQVTTRSAREFFETADILLHPSPRNSYVSSTWVLAAMAAGMAVVATASYSLEVLSLAFGIRLVDNVISEWKQAANELAGILPAAQERNKKFAQQLNEQGELALNRLKNLI